MAGVLIKGEKVDTGRENEWGCAGRDGVRSHKSRKAVSVEQSPSYPWMGALPPQCDSTVSPYTQTSELRAFRGARVRPSRVRHECGCSGPAPPLPRTLQLCHLAFLSLRGQALFSPVHGCQACVPAVVCYYGTSQGPVP